MSVRGRHFIGGEAAEGSGDEFRAFNPTTGLFLGPTFRGVGPDQLDRACLLAKEAFPIYRDLSSGTRAAFLDSVAAEIEDLGPVLVDRTVAETGLPRARVEGESVRTCTQLRLFAQELREGGWASARVVEAQPDRLPLPRPELRQRKIAIGPVAVFGASNFPLAFSVAGGDTAAALAAGCPVVTKGHHAHPGASELVAGAVCAAVAACGLPPGVFSMVLGPANSIGQALVTNESIKAVGFTGSRTGGLALMRAANTRAEPIPVFAEMSSINPVILLPGVLRQSPESLSKAFVASLTLNAGQFCTNPGLVMAIDGPELDEFINLAGAEVAAGFPQTMLTRAICEAYERGVATLTQDPSVIQCARSTNGQDGAAGAALFETTAHALAANTQLAEEVFGPCAIIVRCPDISALITLLDQLEGQLTATIHFAPEEREVVRVLLPHLERVAGRVIANGWPTGVELADAMMHGGPFPATSDSRFSSVGITAMQRFLRPVCYQDFPEDLVPSDLRGVNLSGLNTDRLSSAANLNT